MPKQKRFIQEIKMEEGSLSKQLEIPVKDKIPFSLLKAIKRASTGETIQNPTKAGRKKYKVTRLLKRRAVLALTLKRLAQKNIKRKKKKRKIY